MRKKWEYMNTQRYASEVDVWADELNEYGNEGWELVAVTQYKQILSEYKIQQENGFDENSLFTAFFKREIID